MIGLAAVLLAACSGAPKVCGGPDTDCQVADGRYYALPPAGWNGRDPLPTVFHFHGYGGQPEGYLAKDDVIQAFSDGGALLVLPAGEDENWGVRGTVHEESRDDIAFIHSVLDKVSTDYPVEAAYASGFSVGGSMTWDLMCFGEGRFEAFGPISGAFWEPLPEECTSPARPVLHTHGTSDDIVPMEGRPIGLSMHQGDVMEGWAILKAHAGCPDEPSMTQMADDPLMCDAWTCADGVELRLCLHDGGHYAPSGWVERELAFFGASR